MGLSLKSIGRMISVANTISSGINAANMIGGLNLQGLSPDNIGGIKDSVMNSINGKSNDMLSQITSAIDTSELQNMVNGMNIEGQVNSMMSDIQSKTSSGNFDANSLDIEGQVSQMISGMGLDNINFM